LKSKANLEDFMKKMLIEKSQQNANQYFDQILIGFYLVRTFENSQSSQKLQKRTLIKTYSTPKIDPIPQEEESPRKPYCIMRSTRRQKIAESAAFMLRRNREFWRLSIKPPTPFVKLICPPEG
jgi:hypothetical protein